MEKQKAVERVPCALCGKMILEENAHYIGQEGKLRPYCDVCACEKENKS